jgi:hypothetical protein
MGKARILGGGAGGLYLIERIYDQRAYERERAQAQSEHERWRSRAEELATQHLELSAELAAAQHDLDEAISAYQQALDDPSSAESARAAMVQAATVQLALLGKVQSLRTDLAAAQINALSADNRIQRLEAARPPASEPAWCADLTENAIGEVETVEINGEPGQPLIIAPRQRPGGIGGTLLPREWMTPEQAYFLAALLPGWQKWRPTYRTGLISAVDQGDDRASVELDRAISSAHGLPINPVDTLHDVPIDYMSCNADAFGVGDHVLVRFDGQRWDGAKIVGFVQSPRSCLQWTYTPITNPASGATRVIHFPDGFSGHVVLIGAGGFVPPGRLVTTSTTRDNTVAGGGGGGAVLLFQDVLIAPGESRQFRVGFAFAASQSLSMELRNTYIEGIGTAQRGGNGAASELEAGEAGTGGAGSGGGAMRMILQRVAGGFGVNYNAVLNYWASEGGPGATAGYGFAAERPVSANDTQLQFGSFAGVGSGAGGAGSYWRVAGPGINIYQMLEPLLGTNNVPPGINFFAGAGGIGSGQVVFNQTYNIPLQHPPLNEWRPQSASIPGGGGGFGSGGTWYFGTAGQPSPEGISGAIYLVHRGPLNIQIQS